MAAKVTAEMSTQHNEMLCRDTPACSFMILPCNAANVKGCVYSKLSWPTNQLGTPHRLFTLLGGKQHPQSLKTKAKQKNPKTTKKTPSTSARVLPLFATDFQSGP